MEYENIAIGVLDVMVRLAYSNVRVALFSADEFFEGFLHIEGGFEVFGR